MCDIARLAEVDERACTIYLSGYEEDFERMSDLQWKSNAPDTGLCWSSTVLTLTREADRDLWDFSIVKIRSSVQDQACQDSPEVQTTKSSWRNRAQTIPLNCTRAKF